MAEQKAIRIGGKKIKLTGYMDGGCERACFGSNYKKNGKSFIVKRAHDKDGVKSNTLEYNIYQALVKSKSEYVKMFPEFAALSACGRFVLVERCITAEDHHGYSCRSRSSKKVFKERFLYDDHDGNWGYTLKAKRAVIIDMAHGIYGFRALAKALDLLKRRKFKTLTKRKKTC